MHEMLMLLQSTSSGGKAQKSSTPLQPRLPGIVLLP
jgi:hypothetical protein